MVCYTDTKLDTHVKSSIKRTLPSSDLYFFSSDLDMSLDLKFKLKLILLKTLTSVITGHLFMADFKLLVPKKGVVYMSIDVVFLSVCLSSFHLWQQ